MYNKKFRNYILLYAGDIHLSTAKIALSKIKLHKYNFTFTLLLIKSTKLFCISGTIKSKKNKQKNITQHPCFCFLFYWLHLNGNWVTLLVCTCKCYSVLIFCFTNKYHPFFYLSFNPLLFCDFLVVCWVILNSIQTMTPSCLLLIHPTPGYQMTQRCGRWRPGLFQTLTVNIIIVSVQINVYYVHNVLCMCEQ